MCLILTVIELYSSNIEHMKNIAPAFLIFRGIGSFSKFK